MNKFNTSLIAVVITAGLALQMAAQAAVNTDKVFGDVYQPVAKVGDSQAQVVFYRAQQSGAPDATQVYVDGEFQSALLEGMYTTFCVAPGEHGLGAFRHDAPLYEGKTQQIEQVQFDSGKTYFVRVDNSVNGRAEQVTPQIAAQELKGLRAQKHTLNRASAVEACRYTGEQYVEYALSGDVLFNFGKSSRRDISASGRKAISDLIRQLHQENVHLNRIEIIGHTDPIGKAEANLRLGQQRANTVRTMLIDGGLLSGNLSASSAGSEEPVINECYGSRAEQIHCYAPNRRVVVRVHTSQE